jgi:hypothetical protein
MSSVCAKYNKMFSYYKRIIPDFTKKPKNRANGCVGVTTDCVKFIFNNAATQGSNFRKIMSS